VDDHHRGRQLLRGLPGLHPGGPAAEIELYSTDGLTYTDLTSPGVSSQTTNAVSGPLPHGPDPYLDILKPHQGMHATPLGGGGVLLQASASEDLAVCPLYTLDASLAWHCRTLPVTPPAPLNGDPVLRQDSRGWLHEVTALPSTPGADPSSCGCLDRLLVATSTDGGASWASAVVRPPRGGSVTYVSGPTIDVAANGAAGRLAVVARVQLPDGGGQQDMVFRFDTSRSTPVHTETAYVGRGDLGASSAGAGAGTAPRFDFDSIAMLPDGTVAAVYDDSTTGRTSSTGSASYAPAFAVEGTGPDAPADLPEAGNVALLAVAGLLAIAVPLELRRRRASR